jgi:5-methylcytosine-specific restriction enzyme subunit McrC
VQLPQTTLQVMPKMYRHEDAKEREATANLLFLLSYTRKLDVTDPEISRLTEQRAPFSEILFWIFAHRLWDAVHREVLRGYVTIEDRLAVLKGRWLVAAQAGRPDGWRRDRFEVAYDEFTEDNLPNRLFKATVHRLSRWSQWTDTRRRLTQLRAVFADVADVTPQPHDFDQAAQWMLRHRRRANEGHLYRPLLKLAQMFWTGTGPQPSPGRTETFAFLFDMNQLFEEF